MPKQLKQENLKQTTKATVEEIKKTEETPVVLLSKDDQEIASFVKGRADQMKQYRKGLKIEERWREADVESVPTELSLETGGKGKRFEQDQETGLRSRMVEIGSDEENWRSNNSDATLLTKIQTALSILVDKNPEAVLVALKKKYEATNALIYSCWKRNWEINNSKDIYKLFIFNLAKYGWAPGRIYPKTVKYPKKILVELDPEDPTKNKYETRDNVWFDDVCRENLSPYRTWIDENTRPYQPLSMNDCYYEVDLPYDLVKAEYDKYPNFKFVKRDSKVVPEPNNKQSKEETNDKARRKDMVTIGFYENRLKDLFVITAPAQNIPIYSCPLPNDDGNLSIFQTPWILRSAESPYGISLWEIIKQDKALYDKMVNMTMDQLTLSIMKMFFYTGTSNVLGDGKIKIKPGQGKQIINGKIDWLEVPGPGQEAWEGLRFLKSKMDDNSGITPTLEGEVTGKTLGEVLHAKEAALKRMRMPLDNVIDAIEQDAYITISWMMQKYTTPEIKEFASIKEIQEYEKENQVAHSQLFQENPAPGQELPEKYKATYYPQVALHLEDSNGQLKESQESKFFQIGKDIKTEQMNWKGIFKIIPKSIIAQSQEMEQQKKAQLANQLAPLLVQPPELYKKLAVEMIKAVEEDPEDWLPDAWLMDENANPLFIQDPNQTMPAQGATEGEGTMQNNAATAPNQGGQTMVPQNQMAKAAQVKTMVQGLIKPQ